MLLWLLLLHLAIHLLTASRHAPEIKNSSARHIDRKYIIKRIDSCPDIGYYFKREQQLNSIDPGDCYLCFCQGDRIAVCWKRENKRCDVKSFHYNGLEKRDTRIRRSPVGINDIFFRDAARDVFNRQTAEQCKPFESSFSDGCPPADWCIGCTVCDCDANGRWDCHILSFCPDKKGGKKLKRRKQRINVPPKYTFETPKMTITTPKRTTLKSKEKLKAQPKRVVRADTKTASKAHIVKKSVTKQTTKYPKKKPPLRYRAVAKRNATVRRKIINKNVTHKSIDVVKRSKMQKVINSNNATLMIAQQVVKRVLAAVQKLVRNELKNMTKIIMPQQKPKPAYKKVNKRQVQKRNGNNPHMKKFFIRNKRNADVVDMNSTLLQDNLIYKGSTTTETLISNNSLVHNHFGTVKPLNESEYYKYSLGVNQSVIYKPIVVNDVNQTQTYLTQMNTEKEKIFAPDLTINVSANEIFPFLENNSIVNDLKSNKRGFVKVFKEKYLRNDLSKTRNIEKVIKDKFVENNFSKTKVHTKDVERKLGTKKYNIVKFINGYEISRDDINNNQSTVRLIRNKLSDLHNSMSNLFRQFHKNNTIINKSNRKRIGIMKYLKKLFTRIFKPKKSGIGYINNHKVIETLCNTFGPCSVNKKNKLFLKLKLKELNMETMKIFKTIQIIKGLLRLIDMPTISDNMKKPSFGNDIQKLNKILRGEYNEHEIIPLSATQVTQIDYIKKNTHNFIESVSKFITVLNDIVSILTNNTNTQQIPRITRGIDKQDLQENPFKNFRNLLHKYNLVQNNFIKKMYQQLSVFENKMKERKVSYNEYNNPNNTVVPIETFSNNIIMNLRKLRQVAQFVNSSSRVKRDTMMKEDSIEYLLMVMEYLMKQNYPLDVAPANDGIDLLIDAIRNAPDIKLIKKKMLVLKPDTLDHITRKPVQRSDISEDSTYFTEKALKEDSKSTNNNKDFMEQILDDEKEIEEKLQFDRKAEYSTEAVYYNKEDTSTEAHVTEITGQPSREDNGYANKGDIYIGYNIKREESTNHDKNEPDIVNSDYRKMDETESDINDAVIPRATPFELDNEVIPIIITTPVTDVTQESTYKARLFKTDMRNVNLDESIESIENKLKFDAKSQIDWIEENFGTDSRRLNISDDTTTSAYTTHSTASSSNVIRSNIEYPRKFDVLNITNDVKDKKKKKYNPEEVMLKKQMDLLNSLDYGTERSEFIDSNSKESNDDRYSSDSFPNYFV